MNYSHQKCTPLKGIFYMHDSGEKHTCCIYCQNLFEKKILIEEYIFLSVVLRYTHNVSAPLK